ncbi:HpcH/HpaI aldolase family protein [Sagittula salina]|uniref:2,4-dihydroxyhept-2-ene-1,7-dioic acid aldolase n=1 Tax=Sagittula salina TaxID=2820268 RepID=A0A940MI70_9RHOB|nr:aldolase/citrate lyase family protein [Sagittula salina]MBP0482215.1 2,4-dihydroxyhept-2-ene-1,7-dioic acid aldolase [Sagittula salina]
MNRLKDLWASGRPALNGWCSIGSPFTAEIMAAQGYDSLSIDWQHGALDYSDLLPMLQAIRASGVTPMVRVPWLDPTSVMKALDAGAMGIICPMISTRQQAEDFVSYMRYPPQGQRSYGPTRAGFAMPGYGVGMNDHVLALAMIETKEGVENLEEIAATPGLDGLYVGPADLTLGTQDGRLPPGFDREEPEMTTLIRRIATACKANGIRACLHCGTPDYAAKAIGWGYDLTTVSGDTRLLAGAAKASVDAFRALTKRGD